MKRWAYFYQANGLMVRWLCSHYLLWISVGHRAEWQFQLTTFFAFDWPKPNHRLRIYQVAWFRMVHAC